MVARVGGDEFIMLLPETNARDALIVADRVRTAVGALRVDFDGRRFGVTVSLGIAPVDPSWTTASEVLAAAQAGLEHSKAEGKNQVRLSGAFSLSALELDPFQLALMRGTAVRAAHQPIFDLQAGQITGYEMLSRPQIEGLGSPMKLFRMAESRGLTDAADIACLRACARAAAELEGIIHLNLLPTTLRDVPADRLLALLPPQLVRRTCLELCEHHLVESATELTEAVAALRAAGVRVALDDVGFGRTSLETLLSQIERRHPKFREANRLLADYYHKLGDHKRQAQALEQATKRGRYKHDPQVLLSLAKAYAKQKRYGSALKTMGRVERKMRNLPAKKKADAFKFYAEMLEFEFLRQYHKDPRQANVSLVDRAVTKWERYRTFSRGADAGGVAKANARIKKLEELKNGLEL